MEALLVQYGELRGEDGQINGVSEEWGVGPVSWLVSIVSMYGIDAIADGALVVSEQAQCHLTKLFVRDGNLKDVGSVEGLGDVEAVAT